MCQTCNLELHSSLYWQPTELTQNWSDVVDCRLYRPILLLRMAVWHKRSVKKVKVKFFHILVTERWAPS